MTESPHSISSSSGASGQTLGQRLTYFIRLSGRRDRSNTTWVDSAEEEEEEEAGGVRLGWTDSANPPAPSVCHIPLLCILWRAETANHAETNVKINHNNLSCSALTCSPLVTFPFHSSSRAISFFPNKKDPLHSEHPCPPFYAKRAAVTLSSPWVLSLAWHNTAEALWGSLWCANTGVAHANVSFG